MGNGGRVNSDESSESCHGTIGSSEDSSGSSDDDDDDCVDDGGRETRQL